MTLRNCLGRAISLQAGSELLRQGPDLLRQRLTFCIVQDAPHLRDSQRQEIQEHQLGGERLRRRNADLDAGVGVEHGVDLSRDLRARRVRDRKSAGPQLTSEADRAQRVRGLPRLRDRDRERVLVEMRFPISPFARDLDVARDARPLLDRQAANEARVISGPAGDDDDALEPRETGVGHRTEPQRRSCRDRIGPQIPRDRLAHGVRLLVDLLEHVRLVSATLGRGVVPWDDNLLALPCRPIGGDHAGPFGRDRDDFVVLD